MPCSGYSALHGVNPNFKKSISDKESGNSRVSKSSQRSRSSKVTKSSKEKEIKEQVKLAELMAEASLLQEKQMIQNETAVMEMKERLAGDQARARAYTNIALDDFHKAKGYQQQILQQQNDQKQLHIKEVDFRNRISQKTGSVVPPCKNSWDRFVEKANVWKPQQALERKTHDGPFPCDVSGSQKDIFERKSPQNLDFK